MTADEFPDAMPGRPLWLVTLADLALLLVGFMVLLGATRIDRGQLAQGMRQGFKAEATAMPVDAAAVEFAPGAAVPGSADALLAWARGNAHDPRVAFTITGAADGTAADVDPTTGSAAVLAADRARAVAAILARELPGARLTIATTVQPGRRAALVTLAFAGEPAGKPLP